MSQKSVILQLVQDGATRKEIRKSTGFPAPSIRRVLRELRLESKIPDHTMTKDLAMQIIVSLSKPLKLPCPAYSIPANMCITGQKLAKVKGSICEGCYCLKKRGGFYNKRPVVISALERRAEAIHNPKWAQAMAFVINDKQMPFFRWHDSGDLQSVEHMEKIAQICKLTPKTKHWLPTREYGIMETFWIKNGCVPISKLIPNLSVRLSATMINGQPPMELAAKLGCQCSGVADNSYTCPSHLYQIQDRHGENKVITSDNCGPCRSCWSQDVMCIIYRKH